MSDYDLPKLSTDTTPKARKAHRCCECRGTIAVGEVYHLCTGLWDDWGSFKTCADCEVLRSDLCKLRSCSYSFEFGGLCETVFEMDFTTLEHITRFMDIRRKRGAPLSQRLWMENRELELKNEVES